MALIDRAKAICRVTSATFNDEISGLIEAGLADMAITDISPINLNSIDIPPLVEQALMTYVKMNFGVVDENVYQRLKKSYDEQKSQMLMSSDYTDFMNGGD